MQHADPRELDTARRIINDSEAVLFDLDGTLADSVNANKRHHLAACTYLGIEAPSHDGFTQAFQLPYTNPETPEHSTLSVIYGVSNLKRAEEYLDETRMHFPRYLFRAAKPLISQLHAQSLYTGIITAAGQDVMNGFVDLNKILPLMDAMNTANDTRHHKPDARVFEPALAALAMYGIPPSKVTYVGDMKSDQQAAENAGLGGFIGAASGIVTVDQFRDARTSKNTQQAYVPGIHSLLAA